MLLLRTAHGGLGIYVMFVIAGWPFHLYEEHRTLIGWIASALLEWGYVAVVQTGCTAIWDVLTRIPSAEAKPAVGGEFSRSPEAGQRNADEP